MTDALTIYTIPACNLPGLLAKLATLSKKSVRINGKEIHLNVLGETRTPVKVRGTAFSTQWINLVDEDGEQVFDITYNVTIDAEVPKIHGWTFLATIDHSLPSGNIIRVNPNTDFGVPEKYRSIGRNCDHCNKIRKRNDTFLLRCDATGEVKQIGRQCIRDFIGHDIENVVAMSEIVSHASPSEGDEDGDWSGATGNYIFTATFLAHTSAVIRAYGWVSREQAKLTDGRVSTADEAMENMFPPPGTSKSRLRPILAKDLAIADEALAWGAALTGRNDYEYNLSIVAREKFIGHRSTGILASLVSAYLRHKERGGNKPSGSKHIGAVKQRLEGISAVVFGYRVFPGYGRGASHLYSFLTADGDVLKWFASHDLAQKLNIGMVEAANRTPVLITGTVKKHDSYEGVKQTMLTRCVVTVAA